MDHQIKKWLVVGAVIILSVPVGLISLLLLFGVAEHVANPEPRPRKFDQVVWKAATWKTAKAEELVQRYAMVKDLQENYVLKARSPAQLRALLGEPDWIDNDGWKYSFGRPGTDSGDGYLLLKFQNDHVNNVEIFHQT